MPGELTAAVRRELAAAADPTRAPAMQAYMKSAMPYRGISARPLELILRPLFEANRLPDFESWRGGVLELWRQAAYREERYAAIALLGHRFYRPYRTLAALPLYEELIVTGAWWDHVDAIATRRIRELVVEHPAEMGRELRAWSRSSDLWKRRSSIIAQVGRRHQTDLALLYDCIEPNLGDSDFFIRKAIGWALRDYAWADPEEIVRFVAANQERLSGLSRREATRNVDKALLANSDSGARMRP